MYNPPTPPNYANCDPRDLQCVQNNNDIGVAYQQAVAIAQSDAAREQCHANADRNDEPFRTQLNAQCDVNYPSGAATGGQSIQYFAAYATDPAIADVFKTPQQEAAEAQATAEADAARVKAQLSKAGQTFVPALLQPAPIAPISTATPAKPVAISSSGPSSIPVSNVYMSSAPNGTTVALPGGFDLSAIPWWGWLAGGGVLLWALGGTHGR